MMPNYDIKVDLAVLKALTDRIAADGQTYNDVLRDLLGVDSPFEAEDPGTQFSAVGDALGRVAYPGQFYSRGLILPDGTELRARYKGKLHSAYIRNGRWFDHEANEHPSPSAAAGAITQTVVNGLRFWEGKRPGDAGWRRLDAIRDHQGK